MIAINSGERVEIVELPSRTRWRGPRKISAIGTLQISPAGRQLLATTADGRAFLWPIPSPENDLHAWIRSVTNAVENGDGVLRWPWEGAAQDAAR